MYYGEIKNCDIANGEGVRVTLFVSGCANHCKNCFQPQTWDFCYGQPFTTETEDYLLSLLSPVYINGLTLLGGEPFEPENQAPLLAFLRRFRTALPGKTVWCYTGFTLEELLGKSGECRACKRGRPHLCFDTFNATQKMTLTDGTELTPALGIGAFADKTLVHEGQCTKVDADADPEVRKSARLAIAQIQAGAAVKS